MAAGDPLGLTILFEPDNTSPSVDIVFVHGLGGRSMHTWSLGKKPELFWPREWLPFEPAMQNARISTFGYDADSCVKDVKMISNVADFANDILLELAFAQNNDLNFGKVNFGFTPRTCYQII